MKTEIYSKIEEIKEFKKFFKKNQNDYNNIRKSIIYLEIYNYINKKLFDYPRDNKKRIVNRCEIIKLACEELEKLQNKNDVLIEFSTLFEKKIDDENYWLCLLHELNQIKKYRTLGTLNFIRCTLENINKNSTINDTFGIR